MKTYSTNALAEALEVDRATLVRALKTTKPDLEKTPGRPTYKMATGARALAAHRAKTQGGTNPSGAASRTAGLTEGRARLAKAQAIKVERENEISQGDWYHPDDIVKAIQDDYAIVREHLLAIPGKCADALAPHSSFDRAAISVILKQEVYSTLRTLAKIPYEKDDNDDTDDDN